MADTRQITALGLIGRVRRIFRLAEQTVADPSRFAASLPGCSVVGIVSRPAPDTRKGGER